MEDNALVHYGVLGMKWGVRRYQNKDGTLTNAGKARYRDSDDKYERLYGDNAIKELNRKAVQSPEDELRELTQMERAARGKKTMGKKSGKTPEQLAAEEQKRQDVRNRRTMSTAELKEKIERLKLERELRTLTDEEINPGRKFVMGIAKDVGEKTLKTALTGAALYGVKAATAKEFDMKEFGEAMFNGGAKKK